MSPELEASAQIASTLEMYLRASNKAIHDGLTVKRSMAGMSSEDMAAVLGALCNELIQAGEALGDVVNIASSAHNAAYAWRSAARKAEAAAAGANEVAERAVTAAQRANGNAAVALAVLLMADEEARR